MMGNSSVATVPTLFWLVNSRCRKSIHSKGIFFYLPLWAQEWTAFRIPLLVGYWYPSPSLSFDIRDYLHLWTKDQNIRANPAMQFTRYKTCLSKGKASVSRFCTLKTTYISGIFFVNPLKTVTQKHIYYYICSFVPQRQNQKNMYEKHF
jgi:hypothetical protein